ncbi:MAG: hypothetical protein KF787_03100 [Phycisphaeraceae bacterium]|nr:hypothetical protein [Phycisphaerae bacterium]MBX3391615.1 hypothetical protein [Phycisphaeraceae bacterium]
MEDKEIKAMSAIATALSAFEEPEAPIVKRILKWAASRYGLADIERSDGSWEGRASASRSRTEGPKFETAADLFDAVAPSMEYEKAITIGYWFQVAQGQPDFNGQEVNSTLKNIGHGIGNITDAFNSAIGRKPSLVIQTQKTGASKQARKQYKLTVAGVRWVEARLANPVQPNGDAGTDNNTEQSNGY